MQAFDRSLYVFIVSLGFVSCMLQRFVQFGSCECSAQPIHHGSRPIVLQAFFLQFVQKYISRESGVSLNIWCGYQIRRMVHLDRMIFSHHATAKLDRGNMAFTDSSKAQDEAQIFWSEICLVRMRHD